ncbi:hypothetical protein B0H14DRAFT_3153366 [Mycena olivaceomarginata]|nr:hypothetical protein B0H14DRAFT_3153366 [Mycena olivaceomarginata]
MEIHHLTFWLILGEPGGSTQNPLILQKNWCFVGLAALEGHSREVLVNYIRRYYLKTIEKCGTSQRLLREFATFDLSDLCRQMAIDVSAHKIFHRGMTQDRVLCAVLDWLRSFPDDPLPRQVLAFWEKQVNAMQLCPVWLAELTVFSSGGNYEAAPQGLEVSGSSQARLKYILVAVLYDKENSVLSLPFILWSQVLSWVLTNCNFYLALQRVATLDLTRHNNSMAQLDAFTMLSFLLAFVQVANLRLVNQVNRTPNARSQTTHLHSLTAVALALLLASSCCAELVSFRPLPLHKCNVSGPAKQPDPLADNSELLDIVLLASVDGKFHALNRTTGHTLWSMLSFSSSSSTTVSPPSSLAPLVRTRHIDQDLDLTDDYLNACQETYIIEPQSGDIYVLAPPHSRSAPLQRFPYSMPELIDMSPFSFTTADDHRVFVGRKATAEVVVELETGEVRFGGADTCPWGPFPDLDARDGREPPPKRREVVVGRTDYHVTIHTRASDKRGLVPAQTLAFSTYGPSSRDNVLQSSYRSTSDGVYMQSLPNGEVISFKARGEGEDHSVLWGCNSRAQSLYSVAIFDVLRNPTQHHTFVLLQPRPRLSAILPKLAQTTSTDQLPYFLSAYIGLVEETGSLFAMSPERFPLVAFTAGRKRRENAMKRRDHGSGDDKCLDRSSLYTDRRCLVGMHPLEGGDGDGPDLQIA